MILICFFDDFINIIVNVLYMEVLIYNINIIIDIIVLY